MTAIVAPVSHAWLPYWLNRDRASLLGRDAKALRSALSEHGVNARGARLYLDYGDRLFQPLGATWIRQYDDALSLHSAIAWLKILQACEMDIAPPPDLVRAVASCCRTDAGLGSIPSVLFRAAWRGWSQAAYAGGPANSFLSEELTPVFRWAMHRIGKPGFDVHQAQRGWSWLRNAWKEDRRNRARPPGRREWAAVHDEVILKNVRLIPLTCVAALEDEGEVMEHCIAEYFQPNRLGSTALVFSAREPDTLQRLATIALRRTDTGGWQIDDIKARDNTAPPSAVSDAAQALLGAVNRCGVAARPGETA